MKKTPGSATIAGVIKKLQKDLVSYDKFTKTNPDKVSGHRQKADTLKRLGDNTGDTTYYDRALEAYSDAIMLSSEAQDLLERSKLYILIGKPALATQDLVAAQESGSSGNRVIDIYILKTADDILKLDSVQNEVKQLITNGQLPKELETVFSDMIGVIKGIRQSVNEHDIRLDIHDDKLSDHDLQLHKVQKALEQCQAQYPDLARVQHLAEMEKIILGLQKQIDTLTKHQDEIDGRLDKLEQFQIVVEKFKIKIDADAKINVQDKIAIRSTIESITTKMQGLADKKDIDDITEEMTRLINEAEFTKDNIDALETRVEDLTQHHETLKRGQEVLTKHQHEQDSILKITGMKTKADIAKEVAILQKQPELYSYYKTFYWTSLNLFDAYTILSTNLVVADHDTDPSVLKTAAGSAVSMAIEVGLAVSQCIPVIGTAIGAVEGLVTYIYEHVKGHKFDNKVNVINKIIRSKFASPEDVSIDLEKIALAITHIKKHDILHREPDLASLPSAHDGGVVSKLKAAKNWIKHKVMAIKDTVLPSIELHHEDDHAAHMALEDVAVTIAYLLKNHEAVIAEKKPLDLYMAVIVGGGGLDRLLEEAEKHRQASNDPIIPEPKSLQHQPVMDTPHLTVKKHDELGQPAQFNSPLAQKHLEYALPIDHGKAHSPRELLKSAEKPGVKPKLAPMAVPLILKQAQKHEDLTPHQQKPAKLTSPQENDSPSIDGNPLCFADNEQAVGPLGVDVVVHPHD